MLSLSLVVQIELKTLILTPFCAMQIADYQNDPSNGYMDLFFLFLRIPVIF
ncbi:MAG: hypothetical protein HGB26_02105 [Desulfobulbaceae bacterium]|nr:hypothetical protein [Desulfobulbaceae bacterium]